MAIYHLSAKICASRSKGKSSVAAAAYRACDKIEDDRTGLIHDFTRKGGHVYGEVMLCENAPAEYADRAVLWNAVEKEEKAKDAQLAREIEVALPAEYDLSDPMDLESMKDMLRNFIQHTFVDKGMCADWNIHNPGNDMHNPHCHIMLTMRPFKENGEWGAKERKAYKLDAGTAGIGVGGAVRIGGYGGVPCGRIRGRHGYHAVSLAGDEYVRPDLVGRRLRPAGDQRLASEVVPGIEILGRRRIPHDVGVADE